MRRTHVLVAAGALTLALAPIAVTATQPAPNSPSCLRGHWTASVGESRRVLKSMVPGPYDFRAKLYMIFDRSAFQYGTPSFTFEVPTSAGPAIAKGGFVAIAGYHATRGRVTFAAGTSTVEFASISIGEITVAPPPTRTQRIPGGPTPFQCRGGTLKVKLPSRSSIGWITLRRSG
jgi:hypothetical protein